MYSSIQKVRSFKFTHIHFSLCVLVFASNAVHAEHCMKWEANIANTAGYPLAFGYGPSALAAADDGIANLNRATRPNTGICAGTQNFAANPTAGDGFSGNWSTGWWEDWRYEDVPGYYNEQGQLIYVCQGPRMVFRQWIKYDRSETPCPVSSTPPPDMCIADAGTAIGHPILPATAEKFRSEADFQDAAAAAPLHFVRIYRSNWGLDAARPAGSLGKAWTHNHSTHLLATPADTPTQVTIERPEGRLHTFTQAASGSTWRTADSADTLVHHSDGTWIWQPTDEDAAYRFGASGQLQTHTARNGWVTSYAYNSAGQLLTVTNPFGRHLALAYDPAGHLTSLTTPDGSATQYGFDSAGRLASVTYPGNQTRRFAYENSAFPHALTALFDETSVRWATFAYDDTGRAISTELAGAADRYQVSYPAQSQASVIDPLGTSRRYGYGIASNQLVVLSADKPAEDGKQQAASRVQDASGLISQETDFNGAITTRTWDVSRRLPIAVTLAATTAQAQQVTTEWHSQWRLPLRVTEANQTTIYTYDAQGNPLSETATDTSVVPSQSRTRGWTYNAQGLLATQTDANGGVTTHTYDSAGNRIRTQNPLGHVSTYAYDSAGRVTQETLPSGQTRTYAYDPRGRLLSQTRNGLASTFAYTPSGQLNALSLANGQAITQTYDPAQRMVATRDSQGQQGAYTLDAMGNRISQEMRDASGSVVRTTASSVDGLNRLGAETWGGN
jgi:YD repeat-containing protein